MRRFMIHPLFYRLRPASCAALFTVLTGCAGIATQTPSPSAEPGAAQAATRPYHALLEASGRLSVLYEQDGANQAVHGSFHWSQQPGHIVLTLLSPLGQTMAIIESTPASAVLQQAGQAPRRATDVDALTAQTLGWPLPVAGLRNWLQGFAVKADGSPFVAMPGSSASATTTQDGWHLQYESWNQEGTAPHPRRIDLQRYTPQAGNVEIRLIIDNWDART